MSNKRYYTNVIPTSLYYKLLEKGMPALLETYAEVFDWLITKGVSISIFPDRYDNVGDDMWRYICCGKCTYGSASAKGWIETANDALHTTIEQLI